MPPIRVEILDTRLLTDEEIRLIERERAREDLLKEISEELAWTNRNDPKFRPESVTRRRLLAIAGGGLAIVTGACRNEEKPAENRAKPSLIPQPKGATLQAKFAQREPTIDEKQVKFRALIKTTAKIRSIVSTDQRHGLICGTPYDPETGQRQDAFATVKELKAYQEATFAMEINISLEVPSLYIVLSTFQDYIYRKCRVI